MLVIRDHPSVLDAEIVCVWSPLSPITIPFRGREVGVDRSCVIGEDTVGRLHLWGTGEFEHWRRYAKEVP